MSHFLYVCLFLSGIQWWNLMGDWILLFIWFDGWKRKRAEVISFDGNSCKLSPLKGNSINKLLQVFMEMIYGRIHRVEGTKGFCCLGSRIGCFTFLRFEMGCLCLFPIYGYYDQVIKILKPWLIRLSMIMLILLSWK